MPETYQRKAALRGSSTTRNELRLQRSALWTCFAERAAPLWTARRKHIAARRGSACRSPSAALDAVRRRSTASAPALRAASLCHVRRLRVRRIGIMRNHRLLGEAVAPEKMIRGEKQIGDMALAFGKRAGESDRIESQVGGLPTGSTGAGIFIRIPPVDLWATRRLFNFPGR